MSERDDIVEELRVSYERYGPTRSILKTKFGVVSGETRLKAVPEWPAVEMEKTDEERIRQGKAPRAPKTRLDFLKLKVVDNIQAVKSADWWEKEINDAAEEYAKQGIGREDVAEKMVKDFPLSERKILRYLHTEFKQPNKVKAGWAGGVAAEPGESHSQKRSSNLPPVGKRSKISADTVAAEHAESEPETSKTYTPKARGVSASEHRKPAYTAAHVKLFSHLSTLVDCLSEYEIEREDLTGQPLLNDRGVPLTYRADILIPRGNVIIEVEGEGSASRDNEERDAYLDLHGYRVVHVSNQIVEYFAAELAEIIAALVAT